MNATNTIITRPGVDPSTVVGKPPPPPIKHEFVERDGVLLERDVAVKLRDGVEIYVDIYRPSREAQDLPVLLAWGPYGKHWVTERTFPGSGVDPEWISDLTGFEAPDARYWCSHGYAVVFADPRGLWNSEGDYPHNGPQEREDLYDTIEWLGAREWSNSRVGMLGVSYLAGSQYQAAAMKPPSLRAISPWECFSDWYREFATHGGIPETGFRPRVSANSSYGRSRTENTAANMWAHPLDDEYYANKYGSFADIDVPAYVVASWSDHGLHTRGTLNAFEQISSQDKWLEVHGQKKWAYFYKPESVERQRVFFDTYLKDEERGLSTWPKVRLEVRDSADLEDSTWQELGEWDPQAAYQELHAEFATGTLGAQAPSAETSATFDAANDSYDLTYTFAEDTEVVGPISLSLWLSADDTTDADVFVIVRKFAADGTEVRYPINALFSDGPVALGWLRASHRELVAEASTPLVPVHPHKEEHLLTPGEPELLEIEVWQSSTKFRAGEQLVVTIQGHDFLKRVLVEGAPPLQILHEELRNVGTWTISSGPERPTVLRIPAARTSQ